MGEVYSAWDEVLGRSVAIKIATAPWTSVTLERFRREAQLAARLEHPGIVRVLDLADRAEPPYIVMELIDGPPLTDVIIREGSMALERVVELLAPVAGALDAMHAAGLVHRDIKPDNILVARHPDGALRPVLIDLGIARESDSRRTKLTVEGSIIGTPLFLAPEIVFGEAQPDQRSDIYSLAVVAFLLLTGKLPIEGRSAAETLRKKSVEDPPLVSDVLSSAPRSVDAVMSAALSRCVHDRQKTASELVRGLNEAVESRRGTILKRIGVAMMLLGALIAGGATWVAAETRGPNPATARAQAADDEVDPIPFARDHVTPP